jgi:hypothetical protein
MVAPRSSCGHRTTWSSSSRLPDTAATRGDAGEHGDGGVVATEALGRRWGTKRGGEEEGVNGRRGPGGVDEGDLIPSAPVAVGGRCAVGASPAQRAATRGAATPRWRERERWAGQALCTWARCTVTLFLFLFLLLFQRGLCNILRHQII